MRTAPKIVARLAESKSHLKSISKVEELGPIKFDSTRFAKNGPRNEFEVLETRTRILNRANETAIRFVRTPAIRTE